MKVKEVREVAREVGLRESQVVLSWGVQRGLVVLPKSVHRSRIEDNLKGGFGSFFSYISLSFHIFTNHSYSYSYPTQYTNSHKTYSTN